MDDSFIRYRLAFAHLHPDKSVISLKVFICPSVTLVFRTDCVISWLNPDLAGVTFWVNNHQIWLECSLRTIILVFSCLDHFSTLVSIFSVILWRWHCLSQKCFCCEKAFCSSKEAEILWRVPYSSCFPGSMCLTFFFPKVCCLSLQFL